MFVGIVIEVVVGIVKVVSGVVYCCIVGIVGVV